MHFGIKSQFLLAIRSPVAVVSHTAAQVIAAFGAEEVPEKKWQELLPTLYQYVTATDTPMITKKSCIEVLSRSYFMI